MRILLTHLGHSCVVLELEGPQRRTRILLDPGSLTPPLAAVADLDAILVTHAHPDHVDADQVRRARGGRVVPLYGDTATIAVAAAAGLEDLVVVEPGPMSIGGAAVEVSAWPHEQIYPAVPSPADYGFLVGGSVFAPGDAFARPSFPIDVLLVPTGGPWMKLSEAIDYVRDVAPRTAVLVHDGGLAPAHRELHRTLIRSFAPEGTTVLTPTLGEPVELGASPDSAKQRSEERAP